MRIIGAIFGLFSIASCATAPPPGASPAVVASAAAPEERSRAAQMLAAAGEASAPTQAEIERTFGRPNIARHEGAGAALTYRLESCALLLLFEADQRNALRLAQAHASARRSGETAPSLDQCASEASVPRD